MAYGLRRLEITTPSSNLGECITRLFRDLPLADLDFATPQKVDLVLGVDAYPLILLPGLIRRANLLAQQTVFGWTIAGTGKDLAPRSTTTSCSTSVGPPIAPWHDALMRLLQRFWTLEEVPKFIRQSPSDMKCETLYATKHVRDSTGRYIVPLPILREELPSLGESLANARRALASVQQRMLRDLHLQKDYTGFMREYVETSHMRRLTEEEVALESSFTNYLPHHGIWQRHDRGRKLRVVFNASYPTSSGRSLNDVLRPGPKLQSDLTTVITRWRRWAVAFCADIRMMFRQIWVDPKDAHLQRIIWSPSAAEPAAHYVLRTVTYGETCAPYLALRTLRQLCVDEGGPFPEAVQATERELYVDDFLCRLHRKRLASP